MKRAPQPRTPAAKEPSIMERAVLAGMLAHAEGRPESDAERIAERVVTESIVDEIDGRHDPNLLKNTLLSKLASIVVHSDELMSAKGHLVDRVALRQLLDDREVLDWLKACGPLAPVKR